MDVWRVTAFSVPTPNGSIELGLGAGKCIVEGCKVKGGGLLEITAHATNQERPARFHVCGKDLAFAVAGLMNNEIPTPNGG